MMMSRMQDIVACKLEGPGEIALLPGIPSQLILTVLVHAMKALSAPGSP